MLTALAERQFQRHRVAKLRLSIFLFQIHRDGDIYNDPDARPTAAAGWLAVVNKTISKARRATAAAATDPDDDVPMSQRVPFRKPSTGGLGVPGKIPSETKSLTRNRRLDGACNEQQPSISNAEVGDANGATKGRQAHFGPIRRIDQEAARVKKEDDAKAYKERYQNAAKRWTSSIIAMPILLVTSWYLFDRQQLYWETSQRRYNETKTEVLETTTNFPIRL
ncbi:hypothetical protein GMORB2_3240 [Geosmithia morbida]|uniref:Uncharacterized protein n=1 Tax=Geosmithia morbida TaxID=1094350 RepID=A0A9P4YNB9_9HYPO|nr:uncharacterized protein GMORB2_3240 [Geosmithia morbida]KAF4120113.1 hypothetical protein GMORB2_3240 [Geosmithia morbida]